MKKSLLSGLITGLFLVGVAGITQATVYSYDFSTDLTGFTSYGSASQNNGSAYLNATTGNGSIFLEESHSAESFTAEFDFFIGGGTGADGFTFAWVSSPGIGSGGGYLGYEGLGGYAVEFDTYNNGSGWDISENHIAVLEGTVIGGLAPITIPEMEDTGWHSAYISFNNGDISVAVDGTTLILL